MNGDYARGEEMIRAATDNSTTMGATLLGMAHFSEGRNKSRVQELIYMEAAIVCEGVGETLVRKEQQIKVEGATQEREARRDEERNDFTREGTTRRGRDDLIKGE